MFVVRFGLRLEVPAQCRLISSDHRESEQKCKYRQREKWPAECSWCPSTASLSDSHLKTFAFSSVPPQKKTSQKQDHMDGHVTWCSDLRGSASIFVESRRWKWPRLSCRFQRHLDAETSFILEETCVDFSDGRRYEAELAEEEIQRP